MNVLLKSARIIDSESVYHNTVKDILIRDGVIEKVGVDISLDGVDEVLSDVCVSQGWTDSSVCFGEPGFEERETLLGGIQTAERSGFTHLLVNPNTYPVIDSQQGVVYMKRQLRGCVAEVHPIGALTVESKGEYLAELFDMQESGAVAFGDYKKAISNSNLLKIALQYTQPFGGIVISFPNDAKIMGKGVVNEHIEGTRLGLKGIPALAEELCVARDLAILEYAGGRLHIPTISTGRSVALIAKAKEKGLDVSCSVAIQNLFFTDEVLEGFNTNYKLLPPLRDRANVEALREALVTGVIDFVTSDHNPLDVELKFKEFDLAAFGSIGLENVFGVVSQYVAEERAVELLTVARKRFGIESTPIVEGGVADLSIFSFEGKREFKEGDILSKSKNSAFIGGIMCGKVYGIIRKGQLVLNRNI
nr:dihydroorotase [uncultured Capnocytophaga sp.]